MKHKLVIICTLLASDACQRADRHEEETSPSLLPPPATDMGTPRTDPSQVDPNLDPSLSPPGTAMDRQNMSGKDDPSAGTAPGAATQNPSDRALTQRIREAI